MQTLIRSATLKGFVTVAKGFGLDPHQLMEEAGVVPTALVDSETRIRVGDACRLLELAATRTDCKTFGLHMAQSRQALDFGIMAVLMGHQRTLREMWSTAIQYRHLVNDALNIGLEVDGDVATLRHELMVDTQTSLVQATELTAGLMARNCQAVLGANWRPRSVSFVHSAPKDTSFHRKVFGCPMHFESEFNALVFSTKDLDMPNPLADLALVRYAQSMAQPLKSWEADASVLEVRQAIFLLLPLEQANIERVAAHLHLSVRTVQRKLDACNTSFSLLLDEVRQNLAQRYMTNSRYSIGRVASLLGYMQQASFTRWFTKSFGMTPKEYRAASRTSRVEE